MREMITKTTVKGLGRARALLYTLESLPLPVLNRLITGVGRELPNTEQQRHVIKRVEELMEADAQDFHDLNLPINLIDFTPSLEHGKRWLQIMGDSTLSFWRRRNNKTAVFSKKVKNLDGYPKYYRQNFHHQTNGYLSDQSAYLYEHQVELLFRGLADPMRRRLLYPMWKNLRKKKQIKILEVACGAGTFTKFLSALFPEAEITAIDMSPNYINYAKRKFINHRNVHFMVGQAEDLPFLDESFDAVVTVYLHHELPPKIREKTLVEGLRVCKSKGFWGLLDAIQLDDDPQLNWAIEGFPETFHEPFFKNYINSPLIEFLHKRFGDQRDFFEEYYFLSKIIYTAKK